LVADHEADHVSAGRLCDDPGEPSPHRHACAAFPERYFLADPATHTWRVAV